MLENASSSPAEHFVAYCPPNSSCAVGDNLYWLDPFFVYFYSESLGNKAECMPIEYVQVQCSSLVPCTEPAKCKEFDSSGFASDATEGICVEPAANGEPVIIFPLW